MLLNPYLAEDRQNSVQGFVEAELQKRAKEVEEEIKVFLRSGNFSGWMVYLFLSKGLQLFRLALPVVFHDHHGGVDFAHRQVCGC